MQKIKLLVIILGLIGVNTSCAFSPKSPVTGFIYTNTQSGEQLGPAKLGTRVGEGCAESYLGLFALGDASITSAAHKAGIHNISHVDVEVTSIFTFYTRVCTKVYGN